MSALLFGGRGILVVGIHRQTNGSLRVYLGARCKGQHFLVWGEEADNIERQWHSSRHLLIDRDELKDVPIMYDDAGWERHLAAAPAVECASPGDCPQAGCPLCDPDGALAPAVEEQR